MRINLFGFALMVAGCSGVVDSSDTAPIAADRPILEWSGTSASSANTALLPSGFSVPDEHRCSKDPTRGYILELFKTGTSDLEVDYHWAPIVPGPQADRPTLDQPEFSLAGTIVGANDSGDDVLADHPFGLDVNSDVLLDAPYSFLSFRPDGTTDPVIHTEVETRTFPRSALGFTPAAKDRVLMRGVWVLDCGHPPYGAEMHPPTFFAYARSPDAMTTDAMTAVMPYRSSLLFNPDVTFADSFSDPSRFEDVDTQPFEAALIASVLHAVETKADRITSHALMVANRFDKLVWHVCAPLPRPAGASLDASWRIAARTGVTIEAAPDDAAGCVRFVATMGQTYAPMALPFADADWPWSQLSASASSQAGTPIDVRQEIIKVLAGKGIDASRVPAVAEDHPPRVDAYVALSPRAGADASTPTAIDNSADDQPFPFYGRIHAAWKH